MRFRKKDDEKKDDEKKDDDEKNSDKDEERDFKLEDDVMKYFYESY